MEREAIADILDNIATLLEIKGENPFKIRAYQNGARALEALEDDLGERIEAGTLGEVKGIGKALVEKIETLYETGELDYYEELRASVAPGLLEMTEIPGMGPKKIKAVHEQLGVSTIDELKAACEEGRVAELKMFGKKSEDKILQGIANRVAYGARHLWWEAWERSEMILAGLRALEEVERAEAAGSLRRLRETVGDLDFIVASNEPAPVMDWFCGQEGIAEVTAHGETKSSIRLEGGLQADLRVVPPAQFVFALHHFTGSKNHNVRMRGRALSQGLSLSEWGLTNKDTGESDPAHQHPQSEADLFGYLGLRYIPPELREDMGEIEQAESGDFPGLLRAEDIRGVFHNHTNASDGRNTLEEMAQAAEERGWEYLGIADHSQAAFQANGLSEERVRAQIEAIRKLNASGRFQVHVFAGLECDILKDGSVDMDGALLGELDYVVASVHGSMSGMSEEAMTQRIVKALENEHVTMLGHLTGRLLLRREGYAVNVGKIIDAAAANGKIIEINASPMRLDMDWRYWRRAKDKGVLACINPDAHHADGLGYFRAGVNVARKGWLTAPDVFNTRPLAEVRAYLGAE